MKFEVLHGKHQVFTKDSADKMLSIEVYPRGSVLETDVDLAKRFNSRGSQKFRLVPDSTPVKKTSPKLRSPEDRNDQPEEADAFSGLTVVELKEIASEEGIDLGDAKLKDDILKEIRTQVSGA